MSSAQRAETFSIEPDAEKAAITAESRLAELGLELPDGMNFQTASLFPQVTGWGWKNDIKNRHRLLTNVHGLLADCLLEGESIVYIAKGVQTHWLEQYFLGLWAASINQTVFVLTNVRLLMFRTNGKGRPKKTFWMVFYSQIKKFKGSWTGQLNLKLLDGRSLSFSGFKKIDRKSMPVIFEEAMTRYQATGFCPVTSQSLENLCSCCLDQVPKTQFACESCLSTYWKPSELAWRSFVFPSWGDFLMGHNTIALLEMFGGIFTWTLLSIGIFTFVTEQRIEPLIGGVLFFLFANGLDALITAHIASKGLHPRKLAR